MLLVSSVRAAIPREAFEPDTIKSLGYLSVSVVFTAVCAYAGIYAVQNGMPTDSLLSIPFWAVYAAVTGTVGMGNWVLAHECGHGAFSKNKVRKRGLSYLFCLADFDFATMEGTGPPCCFTSSLSCNSKIDGARLAYTASIFRFARLFNVASHSFSRQHGLAYTLAQSLQTAVGYTIHSLLLVPYFSWQRSHAVHHQFTNHLELGETHVPERGEGGEGSLKARKFLVDTFGTEFGLNVWASSQAFLHLVGETCPLPTSGF